MQRLCSPNKFVHFEKKLMAWFLNDISTAANSDTSTFEQNHKSNKMFGSVYSTVINYLFLCLKI